MASNKESFNEFRFGGLGWTKNEDGTIGMAHAATDGSRIVIETDDDRLFETQFGYGMILDAGHIIWLKDWQVSDYDDDDTRLVVLNREYFNPKDSSRPNKGFEDEPETLKWEYWLDQARQHQTEKGDASWLEPPFEGEGASEQASKPSDSSADDADDEGDMYEEEIPF